MKTAFLVIVAALSAGPAVAETAAIVGVPPSVVIQTTGAGHYLTDKDGKTLYTYIADEAPGKSACEDNCAKAWPPLLAEGEAVPAGDWSLATRANGSKQWAYKGQPLYRYAKDTGPWAMLGEGMANSWYVAFEPMATPADISIHESLLGRVLADATGMTLYTYDGDTTPGKAQCGGACLEGWQPYLFPAIGAPTGDWTATKRDDGRKQWAYKGKPLYVFRSELRPGSTVGHGGKWQAAVVEPTPPMPNWITVQISDLGPVLANAEGRTLYIPQTQGSWNFEKMRKETCLDACLEKYWKPVLLGKDEPAPVGNWSVTAGPDGARHLTYLGFGVYTFNLDKGPGDVLRGEHYGSGLIQSAGFKAVLQSSMMRLYP